MIVTLRDSSASDFDFIWHIHCLLEKDHIEETWGWDEAWQRQHFPEMIDYATWKIIRSDEADIGVYAVVEEADWLRLQFIMLMPEWQSNGIGSYLLKELFERAAKMAKPIRLNVLKANERAQAFYRQRGFVVVDEIDGRYIMQADEANG